MWVKELYYKNYRNLKDGSFLPGKEINIIFGDNAQGKTNLIEAIWLFCGQKSFRGANDNQLITFENQLAKLKMNFFAAGREQKAEISIGNKREASINDISLKSPSLLGESFYAVVFAPSNMDLIKDGPKIRRQFLDTAISQLRPKYSKVLSLYNRAVMQRNVILKDVMFHSELNSMLDAFEDKIAQAGSYIISQRLKYLEAISNSAPEIYLGISREKEKLTIKYNCTAQNGDYDSLLALLKSSRTEDMKNFTTGIGPHRDDVEFYINDLSVKTYGSQGQQRSVVLAVKLAEAEVLKRLSGEQPVAILDDVMSELDHYRQDFILNHIKGWQVFITCCDCNAVDKLTDGKSFKMENGILTPI